MTRVASACLVGLLLLCGPARAELPAGKWKLIFYQGGQANTAWIIDLANKDGKWTGSLLDTAQGVPRTEFQGARVANGQVFIDLKVGRSALSFEGPLPKGEARKILGSFKLGPSLLPAELAATSLSKLDAFEVNQEQLAEKEGTPEFFDVVLHLIDEAGEHKVKPEEVRGWASRAFTAAGAYGPRFQREVGGRIADALEDDEAYLPIALEYARRTVRMLEENDPPSVRLKVLETLRDVLARSGKPDEAKEIDAQITAATEALVRTTPFAGRKVPGERVVLVELFTGTRCPPCVAADLAFDGLLRTYKPDEVLCLEYHEHIPGPDPLTNPASESRAEFYQLEGTPSIFFNGKAEAPGGGGMAEAQEKYGEYVGVINPLMDQAAGASIKLQAKRAGDKIEATAAVSDLARTGEKVRLRFALVQKEVAYDAPNGLSKHHRVVRTMPGGPEGFPLKDKTARQSVTIDLAEVRKVLEKYLTDLTNQGQVKPNERPIELTDLALVAFIQDDATKEILQAAEIAVPAPQ